MASESEVTCPYCGWTGRWGEVLLPEVEELCPVCLAVIPAEEGE